MPETVLRGGLFLFWARIPPPRNFAKIHARGGRGLQRSQPKDLSPPWGHSRTRQRGAAAVPEPDGRSAKAAVSLGWPGAGRAFAGAYCAGRRGRRGGGRFRGGEAGAFFPVGKKPGRGGAWPRGAHKGRTLGAAARGGHGYRAAGRGRYTAAFRGGRGEGRRYTAGGARIAGRPAFSGARGGGREKNAARGAACVGLRPTGVISGSGAGAKARFRHIRKRFLPGRGLCRLRAVLPRKPWCFGRVAFSAARSDECVTPGGAGKNPRRKTKTTQRKERTP